MRFPTPAAAAALTLWACSSNDTPNNCKPCKADGDCGGGQVCSNGRCATTSSCAPPGSPTFAAPSASGPSSDPGCVRGVVQQSSASTQKLGSHTVGEVVTFDVPAGTGSLTIFSQETSSTPIDSIILNGQTIGNSVVPTGLRDPAGNTVYDDSSAPPPDPSGQTSFYAAESVSTGTMTLPNTTPFLHQVAGNCMAAGRWSMVVNDFAYECTATTGCSGGSKTGTYDVQVLTKPGMPAATGTVDVAFYLVGTALTSATAATDPGVARMVQSLGKLYAGAGLCLGTVTFFDVPAWAKTKYGSGLSVDNTGPCSDLSQMFTLSAPGNQLNFFLVNDLVSTSNNTTTHVVGIDGTIPGPSTIGGTIHSGAAVVAASLGTTGCGPTLDPFNCGSDEVAYIAAHEGGHWMGLYHTTEVFGDSFDPIQDTGTCPCSSCAPAGSSRSNCVTNNSSTTNPTRMSSLWCTASSSCSGGDNLMFWVLGAASKGTLSADQGMAIRSNPAVH